MLISWLIQLKRSLPSDGKFWQRAHFAFCVWVSLCSWRVANIEDSQNFIECEIFLWANLVGSDGLSDQNDVYLYFSKIPERLWKSHIILSISYQKKFIISDYSCVGVKLIFCYLTFTIGLFKQSNILFARFRWSAPVLDKLFWLAKRSIVPSFGCVSKERWDSRSLGQRSAAEPTQLRANQTWTKSPWAFYAFQKKAIFSFPGLIWVHNLVKMMIVSSEVQECWIFLFL